MFVLFFFKRVCIQHTHTHTAKSVWGSKSGFMLIPWVELNSQACVANALFPLNHLVYPEFCSVRYNPG